MKRQMSSYRPGLERLEMRDVPSAAPLTLPLAAGVAAQARIGPIIDTAQARVVVPVILDERQAVAQARIVPRIYEALPTENIPLSYGARRAGMGEVGVSSFSWGASNPGFSRITLENVLVS